MTKAIGLLCALLVASTAFARPNDVQNYGLLQPDGEGNYTVSACQVDGNEETHTCDVQYVMTDENADQLAQKFERVQKTYKIITFGAVGIGSVGLGLVAIGGALIVYGATAAFSVGASMASAVGTVAAGFVGAPVLAGGILTYVMTNQVVNPKNMRQLRAEFVEQVDAGKANTILLDDNVFNKFVSRNAEFLDEVDLENVKIDTQNLN